MEQSPPTDVIREFVLAGHFSLEKVQQMLSERPDLLNRHFEWRPNDTETAIQAAAHVGNRAIAEYLLEQGASLEICTAAMLGRQAEVERQLQENPAKIDLSGAHGIPLLTHAALSGDVALVEMLTRRGATEGVSSALSMAVNKGHLDMTQWLLENKSPDLGWKNYEEKTALTIATERGNTEIADLLRKHGATE
jgi:ankyrin repeat protein